LARWISLLTISVSILIGGSLHTTSTFAAPPPLWLPTPPGQAWRVIQGYGCGTHDDWDFYSLDLAAVEGPSMGAPVYAAAPGTVLAWVPASGTLILDHGDDFYTMYTHMDSTPHTQRRQALPRGAQVGVVGDRGAPGNPHLHFTAFTGSGPGGRTGRQSVPVRFAEGYNLPNIGGCNQHGGEQLVGRITPVGELPYRVYVPQLLASGGDQVRQAPQAATPATPAPQLKRVRIPRRWHDIVLAH
jgi:murein DD-endopeptidase MepM/ murein hydrolase activator NlpD